MKKFYTLIPNQEECQKELDEFRNLLRDPQKELSEAKDLLPLFKRSKQLTSLLGSFHPGISVADMISHEFDLDDYFCDFVVGDKNRGAFCFVEFEDATKKSVFVERERSVPEWSPRFEHGFSQLVDWAFKLHDMEKSVETFEAKFGTRITDFMSLLVIGRDSFLEQREVNRLKWRCDKVVVNSQKIRCITFDQLLHEMNYAITTYPIVAKMDL